MAPMKCPARQETADDFEDSYSLTHLASRWGVSRRDIRQLFATRPAAFCRGAGSATCANPSGAKV